MASRGLLKWAAGKTAKTRAEDLGDITLSMLRGEDGYQARELNELIAWFKSQSKPDVICLSNALLLGLAHRLKSELGAPIVCTLQGEDSFLDALPETHRARCWKTLAGHAADVDLFIAPSRYFGDLMRQRLGLPAAQVRVVYNGINLDGYSEVGGRRSEAGGQRTSPPTSDLRSPTFGSAPVLGYFARMCKEKGLDTLVDTYIELRRRDRVKSLKLRIGGSCGPADAALVDSMKARLNGAGVLTDVQFCPNLDRPGKLEFLRSLSIFSVPALYGEAFGLYLIEALAAGVPVVQPRSGAFPELIEATGGGVLCNPGDPQALADSIEELLLNPARARSLRDTGRSAVFERFSAAAMATETLRHLEGVTRQVPEMNPSLAVRSA